MNYHDKVNRDLAIAAAKDVESNPIGRRVFFSRALHWKEEVRRDQRNICQLTPVEDVK